MTANKELLHEVASLLVEALNLEIAPEAIGPDLPLYGDGLGLDSIDMLEVSLVVSKRYGVQLREQREGLRLAGEPGRPYRRAPDDLRCAAASHGPARAGQSVRPRRCFTRRARTP
jgi:acyl carrier protein